MRSLLLTMLVCLGMIAQLDAGGGDKKSDKDKLQGVWNLVGADFQGKLASEEQIKEFSATLTVTGDKAVWKTAKEDDEATYSLDPAKKPKTIDITTKQFGKTAKGIYKLEADDLRICIDISGAEERPSEFKSEANSKAGVYLFKRGKAK